MKHSLPDHYATLGLHRRCTAAQIRDAYRALARRHHPDLNPHSPDALAQTQALNAAYETLSDMERRDAYDKAWETDSKSPMPARTGRHERNISQDTQLGIQDFLRGTTLEVRITDPANPQGHEIYSLSVPPETAPGARFKLPRTGAFAGGFVTVRVKARPNFRFKVRGSDLRCDLRISPQRATQGGQEMVFGPNGSRLRLQIPPRVGRNEILRIEGEGLPKPRGGRGDLLVRITYRPEIRITRKPVSR